MARNLGNLPAIIFNSIDVSVLLTKIESLNDEVLLLRAGMTCQQTTTETLKKVCEETMSRVDILEGKSFDVNNTDCHDGNTRQHKNRVTRDCASITVELPPEAATDVGKAATIPVEKGTTTDIDEQWSTVARRASKCRAAPNVAIQQRNPASSVKKTKNIVIGTAKVASIVAAGKRGRKANATRFAPDEKADDLKRYLESKLNISVNISQLESKHPESYSSFYVSGEVVDPKVFLDGHIWPEGISVRWYRPAEKIQRKDTFVTSASHDSTKDSV